MTDQTPATEAGRRLLEREAYNSRSFAIVRPEDIIAIEAEARADQAQRWAIDIMKVHDAAMAEGRADALREAADRVRALGTFNSEMIWAYRRHVLAILDPEAS